MLFEFASILSGYALDPYQWGLLILSGMLIGSAKTGVAGAGTIAIPIMAGIFGGKISTGMILPMLCMADIIAVSFYVKQTSWRYVFRIMPGTFAGILIGLIVGNVVSDEWFKMLIALIVLFISALIIYKDYIRIEPLRVPDHWYYAAPIGLLAGFATMVGNAAGPLMAVYLLSKQLPKNVFIATTAVFFFIINLSKVPLHVFFWHTISWNSFTLNIALIPAIALGALLGMIVVRNISEGIYRKFIVVVTIVSALYLLWNVVT